MNILWLSQNLPFPPKTGVMQRNYHLIREASRFANIHLVAILKRDILPGYDPITAAESLREFCCSVAVVDLPTETSRSWFAWVVLKSLFTRLPFTVNWAKAASLAANVRAVIEHHSIDFVYFDTISLAPYRELLDGTPCALNHHNIESALFERRTAFEHNPLKRFYLSQEARKLATYETEAAELFDVNLTVSSLDAEILTGISPKARTAVVANGVDLIYFTPRTSHSQPGQLVLVSGMNWFPNRDAAIYMAREIWPRIAQGMPKCRLTIVGASPPAEVLDLAARDPRVTVTGFVDDVRPFMESAQIYLCPMRDGGGTRLKMLDALAMSRPIVATTMAFEGIPITPEREALVADTPDDFVRQVRRIIESPDLGRRLADNGRTFVERHFSWSAIGATMEAAFRAAASTGIHHD